MKVKLLGGVILLFAGCVVAAACLTVGALTDGDYRFLFLANMTAFVIAGSMLRKWITTMSLLVAILLLSAPYGMYYSTQYVFTPRIIVFPVFNMVAILLGYFSPRILPSVKVMGKMSIYISSCLVTSWFLMPSLSSWVSGAETNRTAPSFELMSLDGQLVKSEDLKGKIIIVDFWATWCAPCIAEFKVLEKFHAEIANRDDVVLLVVNEDNGGDAALVSKFQDKRKFKLPIFIDRSGRTYSAFDANAFPALYIIDRNFNIRFIKSGYNPSENLMETLIEKTGEIGG